MYVQTAIVHHGMAPRSYACHTSAGGGGSFVQALPAIDVYGGVDTSALTQHGVLARLQVAGYSFVLGAMVSYILLYSFDSHSRGLLVGRPPTQLQRNWSLAGPSSYAMDGEELLWRKHKIVSELRGQVSQHWVHQWGRTVHTLASKLQQLSEGQSSSSAWPKTLDMEVCSGCSYTCPS